MTHPTHSSRLRILHVGTGFRPFRRGGLVAYVEDLAREQARRGHEVSYLFAGRYYRFGSPRLKRWHRGGIQMLEVVNSPLHDHGRQPELELSEPRIERIVSRVLAEVRPDVVHVQELAGLPSSVLDIARERRVPVVFTLQDYFALCPMFKLYDSTGNVCLRRDVGADCVATVAAETRDEALLFHVSLRHLVDRLPLAHRIPPKLRERLLNEIHRLLMFRRRRASKLDVSSSEAFQRRRDVNVARLNQVDRLVAMSSRVAEIYETLGVQPGRVTTMQLTLGHIDRLHPRSRSAARPGVTFVTLGGGESVEKGARVLLHAARLASRQPGFRLLILGHVASWAAAEAREIPGVTVGGSFAPRELGRMLADADVGVIPSVWEEAYAYAGVEFLAAGIPVLANGIGGMVDYVKPGETGWINRSCSAPELAEHMRRLIRQPEEVEQMRQSVCSRRRSIVLPLFRHAEEMDALYRKEITNAARTAAAP